MKRLPVHILSRACSALAVYILTLLSRTRQTNSDSIARRLLLNCIAALALFGSSELLVPAYALENTTINPGSQTALSGDVIDLTIGEQLFLLDGRTAPAMTINGTIPGPIIRLKEGQLATVRVTNRLKEDTSIHWHGLLLPPAVDGVPGVSFAGIKPGETFIYRFPVKQSGTYWFHSHSGGPRAYGECMRR